MLEKTRGIILSQIKYTDSGIVVRFYTRKFGRLSFIIKGMRNRKTGKHNILFQPMSILDLEMNYKSSRELQVMKEFSVAYSHYDIYSNIKKSCVVLFLGELLTSVLKEESPQEELFDYIEESINYFENSKEKYANFHLSFLAGLSRLLGFEPGTRANSDDVFFDMTNGTFVPIPPHHGNYVRKEVSDILAELFISSYDSASNIPLNGIMRNEVLDTLVKYYALHLPGLKKIKSLEILKEVFN